jgi:hypothetical protein
MNNDAMKVTADVASALLQLRGVPAVIDRQGDVWTRWHHDDGKGFGCCAIWREKLPVEFAPYTPLVPATKEYVDKIRETVKDPLESWRKSREVMNTCKKCGCKESHIENFDEVAREGDVVCDRCGAFIRTWGIG